MFDTEHAGEPSSHGQGLSCIGVPELDEWLKMAVGEAGVDPSMLGPEAVTVLLDLARDAAHNVARPGAPLATFAVGLALGRAGGGDLAALKEAAGRIVTAAEAWGREHGEDAAVNRPGGA
jgi:hypothetical protein